MQKVSLFLQIYIVLISEGTEVIMNTSWEQRKKVEFKTLQGEQFFQYAVNVRCSKLNRSDIIQLKIGKSVNAGQKSLPFLTC